MFHAFLLVENFSHQKINIVEIFPGQPPKVNEYFKIATEMLEKEEKKTKVDQKIIDFAVLQDLWTSEVSHCFYVLIALVFI
jgi:UPF0288 family protein (methanogenesis marker protein 3)